MWHKVINASGAEIGIAEVAVQGDTLVIKSSINLEKGDAIIGAVPPAMRPIK